MNNLLFNDESRLFILIRVFNCGKLNWWILLCICDLLSFTFCLLTIEKYAFHTSTYKAKQKSEHYYSQDIFHWYNFWLNIERKIDAKIDFISIRIICR